MVVVQGALAQVVSYLRRADGGIRDEGSLGMGLPIPYCTRGQCNNSTRFPLTASRERPSKLSAICSLSILEYCASKCSRGNPLCCPCEQNHLSEARCRC